MSLHENIEAGLPGGAVNARTLIALEDVSKTYATASGGGVHALDSVSLEIRDGEFVCVVGPSGCGKSTMLRLLAGLDSCEQGQLAMDGEPILGPRLASAWSSRQPICCLGSACAKTSASLCVWADVICRPKTESTRFWQ